MPLASALCASDPIATVFLRCHLSETRCFQAFPRHAPSRFSTDRPHETAPDVGCRCTRRKPRPSEKRPFYGVIRHLTCVAELAAEAPCVAYRLAFRPFPSGRDGAMHMLAIEARTADCGAHDLSTTWEQGSRERPRQSPRPAPAKRRIASGSAFPGSRRNSPLTASAASRWSWNSSRSTSMVPNWRR